MKENGVLFGSLASGLLASACCIGPLVLGALGLGSLGFAAALAPLRPWFLGVTTAFLAAGFYLAYRPSPSAACAGAADCAPASRRAQRVSLWVVTALVAGLAAFPAWSHLRSGPRASDSVVAGSVVLDVQGMTCSGCADHVQRELVQVPGVIEAKVDFESARAHVRVGRSAPGARPLLAAIERAGYHAKVLRSGAL